MAKVTGPFGGFHASQQIGKTYVFFLWKGLNVVRTWLIPNNPNTGAQQTVRAAFKALVDWWHSGNLITADFEAWERAAGQVKYHPQSGFNRFIGLYRTMTGSGGVLEKMYNYTVGADVHNAVVLSISALNHAGGGTDVLLWGTSPSSLWHSEACAFAMGVLTAGPFDTGYGAGTVIYGKFKSTDGVGDAYGESGIYKLTLT